MLYLYHHIVHSLASWLLERRWIPTKYLLDVCHMKAHSQEMMNVIVVLEMKAVDGNE